MFTAYLVCLIVGGFFVTLSMFGGAEHDHDAGSMEIEADVSVDTDFDADFDADVSVDAGDVDFHADLGGHDASIDADVGWVDLFSVRALFLFTAFFGLTGTLLTMIGENSTETLIWSVLLGLLIGLGGNYAIKKIGYRVVDSGVSLNDFIGKTATVTIPFEGESRGRIKLNAKGSAIQLVAFGLEDDNELYRQGEEVVIVRMNGNTAEVVKPT